MVIEDKLRENAELYPDKLAVLCNGETYTYAQLYHAVKEKATSFDGMKGRPIPVLATSTVEFLITYFAIHLAGAVAVPLHKDTPEKKWNEYTELLSQSASLENIADILFTTGTTGNAKNISYVL